MGKNRENLGGGQGSTAERRGACESAWDETSTKQGRALSEENVEKQDDPIVCLFSTNPKFTSRQAYA